MRPLCLFFLAALASASFMDVSSLAQVASSGCCVDTPPIPDDPNLRNCGGSRPVGLPFATRSPVMAQHGMAATSQPLSAQVAIDILKAGGHAVDAAIAANAMEGVVEPMMNGMGGDLMAMVWSNDDEELFGLNGSGAASKSTTIDALRDRIAQVSNDTFIPLKGPLPFTVPGAVSGWFALHEKFGKLPMATLLQPAIDYAKNGFLVSPVIASEWEVTRNDSFTTSGGRYPNAVDGFVHTFTVMDSATGERRAPRAGELFSNPDLANTLSKVATGGRDAFYNGSIAAAIAAFSDVAGTLITAEDLRNHQSAWVTPINTTYRDRYRVFELPPNPQGLAALQQLNILENFDLKGYGHNTADYLHVQVESKKLAFADRAKYYADPDFVDVPVEGLLSKTYAKERAALINMSTAADRVDAGTPAEHASMRPASDTIYLTVADGDGNMVSLIQSNFEGFGSGLVVPGLGFALQDRGALFSMRDSDNDVYAPGKRPFHTIIPGFVFQDEKPWLSFGVMGGNMQPQGHVQIICNMVDFGMNVQEAGDAARYYHTGSSQPTGTFMTDGGIVELEAGVCPLVRANLTSRGHTLVSGPNGGGYQAILRDNSFGDVIAYHGASEMRKDGHAVGY